MLVLLTLIIGISYAYILYTTKQKGINNLETDCINVEMEELTDAINLVGAYPVVDEIGEKNKPFRFKLTNKCGVGVNYDFNLEVMEVENEAKRVPSHNVAVKVDDLEKKLLNSDIKITDENYEYTGIEAYTLYRGELKPGASVEHELRLWLDQSAGNDAQNGKFYSKVVIQSFQNQIAAENFIDRIKKEEIVTSGTGLYEVNHSNASITYTNNETAINNLKQTEYRYAGPDPNNYVTFNDEKAGWRIIGLVNTPEGQRLKLTRNESIGAYAYDTSPSSVNDGYGVNEWSQADLKNLLNNGPYYNRTSGTCYNGSNNQTIACDFSSTGLTAESKKMIDTVTWNYGTSPENTSASDFTPVAFYNHEKGTIHGKSCSGTRCNDTVTRTVSWKGQVGLITRIDYWYATSGGTVTNRDKCLSTNLGDWGNETVADCKNNDWMYGKATFTMNPRIYSGSAALLFGIRSNGAVIDTSITSGLIYPVLYLKTNVRIAGGYGTADMPYVILEE